MSLFKINRESGVPLIGHIAFGLVVRSNSNVVQVRATTICNMNCPFCSTDGGPFSTTHLTHYIVDPNYLLEWIKKVAETKGKLHINIDSVGEPTTYPHLIEFITLLKEEPLVSFISMQSNGTLLTKEKIQALEKAGLNRIHLSVHSVDALKSKELFGNKNYNVESVLEAVQLLNKSNIELLLAPVWLPKVNDDDIKAVLKLAKELNCRVGLQKYEEYKYSRKMKSVKKINYFHFYKQLREWEKEFGLKLVLNASDLDTDRAPNLSLVMNVGERLQGTVVAPGWLKGQMVVAARERSITVNDCQRNIGDKVNVRITENKNNIYLAEMA